MANAKRKRKIDRDDLPLIDTSKRRVWFLNGDLVSIRHSSRAAGIITFYNKTQDRMESMDYQSFRKKRKAAYTVSETSKMINYASKAIYDAMKIGRIPYPIGELPGGERRFHYNSYYSEDTVREIRDTLASIHQGRPRKDGLITNNRTPTEQELTYMMGLGTLLYARSSNGEFVPIYSETI